MGDQAAISSSMESVPVLPNDFEFLHDREESKPIMPVASKTSTEIGLKNMREGLAYFHEQVTESRFVRVPP